ncbi:MAG: LD-carboxypeptidase [Cytophagales bacterium]|nr:LD-carboxypeptidase [Cytophagales bacterium]
MKQAPFLKQGDTVAITSTARSIDQNKLAPAIQILESWGLSVILPRNVYAVDNQFAGTVQERIDNIQELIDNSNIKAIFCAKGGYGTAQIIDFINFSILEEQSKWIIGFSDVTVLHNHLHRQVGVQSIHATMPLLFTQIGGEEAVKRLKNVLFGKLPKYKFPFHSYNQLGNAEAPIIGGNLSIIHSLVGTKSDIDTNDKILFLEDLDEYLYHIDRMMIHLKRAGKLDNLAGLVIGGMSDMNDNAIPFGKTAEQIIYDYTKEYDYPIAFNAPIGHIPNNFPIICGKVAHLEVTGQTSNLDFT